MPDACISLCSSNSHSTLTRFCNIAKHLPSQKPLSWCNGVIEHFMGLFCPFKDHMSSATPFSASKQTNLEIYEAEPLRFFLLLAKARSLQQEAPVTHAGAQFIREEPQIYKSPCQKRTWGWARGRGAPHTFAPLCTACLSLEAHTI